MATPRLPSHPPPSSRRASGTFSSAVPPSTTRRRPRRWSGWRIQSGETCATWKLTCPTTSRGSRRTWRVPYRPSLSRGPSPIRRSRRRCPAGGTISSPTSSSWRLSSCSRRTRRLRRRSSTSAPSLARRSPRLPRGPSTTSSRTPTAACRSSSSSPRARIPPRCCRGSPPRWAGSRASGCTFAPWAKAKDQSPRRWCPRLRTTATGCASRTATWRAPGCSPWRLW
mmetsp:Transcript_14493/g.39735  ORF Transcript_14493/g.39735 Transcript_14493/m.39735 type:complete len:225 (+) Transcript_14493:2912-3586(+)